MKAYKVIKAAFAVIVVLVAVWLVNLMITISRIKGKTYSEMSQRKSYSVLENIAIACDKFKAVNGHWPDSLSELQMGPPPYPVELCTDGWDRTVVFIPYTKSLGFGEIISYGRDGKPGGTGLDCDFEIRFPFSVNTNWNDG